MKKLNKNNGITLISLVITIIVMLILVGVSINLAVNGGLFEYAGNAVGDTQNAMKNEQGLIDEIINDYIKPNTMKSYEETEKDKTTGVLKANATYESGDYTAVIPKGFKIIPGLNGTTTIADGLVIQDTKGNEFVWIPVEKAIITASELTKMEKDYSKSGAEAVAAYANDKKIYPMAVKIGENYKGILYSFSGTDQLTVTALDWTSTSSYREPAYFSEKYDNTTNLGSDWNKETFQNAYDKMVESVAKNDGFYVGRYEISKGIYTLEAEDTIIAYAQSQSGKTAMVSTTWHDMYKYESNYAKYNESLGVTSEMIWGSQWDQMMIFVNGKNDGAEKASKFYVTTPGNRKSDSSSTETGEYAKDQVANIFDLEGSRYEWTQEAYFTFGRVYRGGSCKYGACVSNRADGVPSDYGALVSSRLALYIK